MDPQAVVGVAVGVIAVWEAARRTVVWWMHRHDQKQDMKQKVDSIYMEMHPNGGSSLKDQITLIGQDLSATKATVEATQKGLSDHIQFHLETNVTPQPRTSE